MASTKEGAANVSFIEATQVEKLDLHTYKVDLSDAFIIGAGMEQILLVS